MSKTNWSWLDGDVRYDNCLSRFVTELGANNEKLVKNEARLLLKLIISWTPPRNYAAGKAAITGDVAGTSAKGKAKKPIVFQLQDWMMETANFEGSVVRLWSDNKRAYGVKKEDYAPNMQASELLAIHKAARNKNTGRAETWKQVMQLQDKNWMMIQRKAVQKKAVDKLLKTLWKRVGRLKASFGTAYQKLGGNLTDLPTWVRKHVPSPFGFADEYNHGRDYVAVEAISTAPNVDKKCGKMVNKAISVRAKKMEYDFRLYMKGVKDRTNLR